MALEMKRLESRRELTLLLDGWEDASRRSLYGTLACERDTTPVMMGLQDMSGERGDARALVRVVKKAMADMGVQAQQCIAAVSDDPNTMRKYRRLLQEEYPWIIVSILTTC